MRSHLLSSAPSKSLYLPITGAPDGAGIRQNGLAGRYNLFIRLRNTCICWDKIHILNALVLNK